VVALSIVREKSGRKPPHERGFRGEEQLIVVTKRCDAAGVNVPKDKRD
jgi:hypothetical protein